VATGLLLLGGRQRLRSIRHTPAKSAPLIVEMRRRLFAALGSGADHAPRH
jgi:hypothetical protein